MRDLIFIATAAIGFISSCFADAVVNIGNNSVSTGKIIINGQDVSSQYGTTGSGVVKSMTRQVADFSAIRSQGSFDLDIKQGVLSVEIEGDDNLLDLISTQVVGEELRLSMNASYSTNHALMVHVSAPRIRKVSIAGTSDVAMRSIRAGQLTLELQGAVDLTAGGQVEKLNLQIQGSGDVNAKNLRSRSADLNVNGTADVQIMVTEELNVSLHGTGDVTYYGHPAVLNKVISGLGDIESGE